MLLKCKQCGYENQIGSIFCRGCGAKVDSSALDPDSPDASAHQKEAKKQKAIETMTTLLKRGVTCLILAFLIVTACFLFSDADAPKFPGKENINTISLMDRINKRKDVVLSPEAMTLLFKEQVMDNIVASGGNYVPEEVIFQCDGAAKDILKISIRTKIAGIGTVCTLRGKLRRSDDGNILFDALSVRLGKVNLPFARETVMKKFDSVLNSQAVRNLFRNASSVQFINGELHVSYGL